MRNFLSNLSAAFAAVLIAIVIGVFIFPPEQKPKVITKCYLKTEVQEIKDTVLVVEPDTTWLSDTVFVITVLLRDTVTVHVDTTFSRTSEPGFTVHGDTIVAYW